MKNVFFAIGAILLSGCSESDQEVVAQPYQGEKYPIEFSSPVMASKAPEAGYGDLILGNKVNLSVFKQNQPAAEFLGCRYLVTEKLDGSLGLSFDNTTDADNAKEKIVELTVGTYDIYAAAINDGGLNELTPVVATPESNSTYATEHGFEYLRAEKKGQVITDDGATRNVLLSFTREVAKLNFTFVAGSGVTLPPTMVDGLVTEPKVALPTMSTAVEGVLNLQTGITAPLTGEVSTLLSDMYVNVGSQVPGIYMYVLPCNLGATAATYRVYFNLELDGSYRTFEMNHIPMPTSGGHSVFEKGKQYNYTVTVNNTGLYVGQVQVEDWTEMSQGGLTAE